MTANRESEEAAARAGDIIFNMVEVGLSAAWEALRISRRPEVTEGAFHAMHEPLFVGIATMLIASQRTAEQLRAEAEKLRRQRDERIISEGRRK